MSNLEETFLVRWRGRQEGPFPAEVINTKLASNEIGLLHEILHQGQWITIRDYVAQQETSLRAESDAREAQEQHERAQEEQRSREREEESRAAMVAEERRRNDLLAADLERQHIMASSPITVPGMVKPHRSGTILVLAVVGLVFGPFCLIAFIMGNSDLRAMRAGMMDSTGQSTTSTARSIAAIGLILWVAGIAFILVRK